MAFPAFVIALHWQCRPLSHCLQALQRLKSRCHADGNVLPLLHLLLLVVLLLHLRYYVLLPANKLELWFALESERFQVPVFRWERQALNNRTRWDAGTAVTVFTAC